MPRKRYSVEAIIGKLREAEVALGQGATVEEVIGRLGISEPTYYCWRRSTAACSSTRRSDSKTWNASTRA